MDKVLLTEGHSWTWQGVLERGGEINHAPCPRNSGYTCGLNLYEIVTDAGLWSQQENNTDLGKGDVKQTVRRTLGNTGGFALRPFSTAKRNSKNVKKKMTSLTCQSGIFLYPLGALDNEDISDFRHWLEVTVLKIQGRLANQEYSTPYNNLQREQCSLKWQKISIKHFNLALLFCF